MKRANQAEHAHARKVAAEPKALGSAAMAPGKGGSNMRFLPKVFLATISLRPRARRMLTWLRTLSTIASAVLLCLAAFFWLRTYWLREYVDLHYWSESLGDGYGGYVVQTATTTRGNLLFDRYVLSVTHPAVAAEHRAKFSRVRVTAKSEHPTTSQIFERSLSEPGALLFAGFIFSNHTDTQKQDYLDFPPGLTQAQKNYLDGMDRVRHIPYILHRRFDYVMLPFWFIMVVVGIPFWLACLRWRKARIRRRWLAAGCCVQCGYDLRDSPEVCPECGTGRAVSPDAVPALSDAAMSST